MTKWADKLIVAVRYNSQHTHIDFVQARKDLGDKLDEKVETLARQTVISQIKAGTSFATAVRGSDGKWASGAPVQIIRVSGVEYLKTVADNTTRDNLGELPEF